MAPMIASCGDTEDTPNSLSPDRLAEIREREQAATSGPWGTRRDLNGVYTVEARPRIAFGYFETDGDVASLAGSDETAYHNGQFIARSREDVHLLLAEVERADRRTDLLMQKLARFNREVKTLTARAETAEAKVRRAETVKCWTNEDGKRFVFAEDLAVALGYESSKAADR